MLFRLGHVTNSSSTTHILMWKGDLDNLRELLEAHIECFRLTHEIGWDETAREVTLDPEEVINAIIRVIRDEHRVTPVKTWVAQVEHELRRLERDQEADQNSVHWRDYWAQRTQVLQRRIALVNAKGYTAMAAVDFGDNHGDVRGCDMGIVMDYAGRNIHIVTPKLAHTTEQNR